MKFLSKRNKPIEAKAEHTQAVFAVDDLAALVADQFDKAQRLESKVNSLEKEAVSLEKVEQERDAAVISANRSKREVESLEARLKRSKMNTADEHELRKKSESERDVYRARLAAAFDAEKMSKMRDEINEKLIGHNGNLSRARAKSYVDDVFNREGVE